MRKFNKVMTVLMLVATVFAFVAPVAAVSASPIGTTIPSGVTR